ncbi:integrase [Pseudomonas fragi]|nr:integrase [Pseudomonas fragi]
MGCQNLVITPNDIKKYFCYIFFHDYLLDSGDIDEKEYRSAISEKRFIWTEYILPKYSKSLIEKMKTEASVSPIPEWDISNYENNKNESLK